MTLGTKILTVAMVLFIALSASAKYYKFSVAEDYFISAELGCDTETESCFVWDCNPEDPDCDQTPYKYIWKYAANVPDCDPRQGSECKPLECSINEKDCEIIYCSKDTLGEEEYCDQ